MRIPLATSLSLLRSFQLFVPFSTPLARLANSYMYIFHSHITHDTQSPPPNSSLALPSVHPSIHPSTDPFTHKHFS
ncbi:hypothetical protein B0J11DRAFT_533469 [Dendryphion nanum]|uniref:Uncharacterized protein n=1 Tax=Dendryphion nanum TaxID=256645 RepID=A0A9P9DLF6_9PLEO|nr:hypothetical protein B0J11DRAFT_533469 [Dendryphion nanum]